MEGGDEYGGGRYWSRRDAGSGGGIGGLGGRYRSRSDARSGGLCIPSAIGVKVVLEGGGTILGV